MKQPMLLILAAGMGSRYGGLKQLDGVGPHGETIMDYSVYDALRAGFGSVVFVVREHFAEEFRQKIVSKYDRHLSVELVFQELDRLPAGFDLPEGRTKPWGTNHALLMAKDVIDAPFAAINADDFYGRESFAVLGERLGTMQGTEGDYCMVGYRVGNTLSESGSVARGVCTVDGEGYLRGVVERTAIERIAGNIGFTDEEGQRIVLAEETPVSMNMWGFTPDYFVHSERYFADFLRKNIQNLKSEYFIPLMVNHLLETGTARVKMLDTPSQWFGVTYAADRPSVVDRLRSLVDAGVYPSPLF
ncbi:MAG: nucleotidyltransferase [Tannerellaceae bacterium]|jgi:hypothetical protein|nr:nucleotidyltransferase [Tannerellaceae bacterium]